MSKSGKGNIDLLMKEHPVILDGILSGIEAYGYSKLATTALPKSFELRQCNKVDTKDKRSNLMKHYGLYPLPGGNENFSLTGFDTFMDVMTRPTEDLIKIDIDAYNAETEDWLGKRMFPFSNEADLVDFIHRECLPKMFGDEFRSMPGARRKTDLNVWVGGNNPNAFAHKVKSLQIEIDGVFENQNTLITLEAKIGLFDDLTLRQAHIPNYYFQKENQKRQLLEQKNIVSFLASQVRDGIIITEIVVDDINKFEARSGRVWHILCEGVHMEEAFVRPMLRKLKNPLSQKDIPQVNDLNGLIDLVYLLPNIQNRVQLAKALGVKTREVGYRISAALTLELIEKGVKGEFTLTPSGKALKSIVCPRRRLTILKKIIEKNLAFKKILSSSQSLSRAKISDVLNKNMFEAWSKINGDTRQRRLQCLLSWFKQLNSV